MKTTLNILVTAPTGETLGLHTISEVEIVAVAEWMLEHDAGTNPLAAAELIRWADEQAEHVAATLRKYIADRAHELHSEKDAADIARGLSKFRGEVLISLAQTHPHKQWVNGSATTRALKVLRKLKLVRACAPMAPTGARRPCGGGMWQTTDLGREVAVILQTAMHDD